MSDGIVGNFRIIRQKKKGRDTVYLLQDNLTKVYVVRSVAANKSFKDRQFTKSFLAERQFDFTSIEPKSPKKVGFVSRLVPKMATQCP